MPELSWILVASLEKPIQLLRVELGQRGLEVREDVCAHGLGVEGGVPQLLVICATSPHFQLRRRLETSLARGLASRPSKL
eukprot:4352108-Pyramimonas_sp.AAC.2